MTGASKPQSELVARIHSALGSSAYERRGRAALEELVEQLEAAQAELTEWRTSIATERLTEQLETAHEALRRIADGSDYTWGNIARLALEGIEVDPNEPSDGRDLRGGVLP